MIHAYDELYLNLAQRNLGDAFDFALVTLGIDMGVLNMVFSVSRVSRQFSEGNPKYVAGMNGCELARYILDESGLKYQDADDAMYLDKSPEYWAGWALSEYQWYSGRRFRDIFDRIKLSEIITMYRVFHEMDIRKFIETMETICSSTLSESRLKTIRESRGLSQAELARGSGINLRNIQMYEQRVNDINRAQARTVYMLARAIGCHVEDLLDNPTM